MTDGNTVAAEKALSYMCRCSEENLCGTARRGGSDGSVSSGET